MSSYLWLYVKAVLVYKSYTEPYIMSKMQNMNEYVNSKQTIIVSFTFCILYSPS